MKLSPANQTFIPAAPPQKQGYGLISLPTNGAVLKRLTVVASSPDDNVMVLQADYADASESAPASLPAATSKSLSYDSASSYDPPSDPPAPSRNAGYLTPIQQYVRTQRGTDAKTAAPLVDVRA